MSANFTFLLRFVQVVLFKTMPLITRQLLVFPTVFGATNVVFLPTRREISRLFGGQYDAN